MSAVESLLCPHCGADLDVPDGVTVLRCKYCGSKLQLKESGSVRALALIEKGLGVIGDNTARTAEEVERLHKEYEGALEALAKATELEASLCERVDVARQRLVDQIQQRDDASSSMAPVATVELPTKPLSSSALLDSKSSPRLVSRKLRRTMVAIALAVVLVALSAGVYQLHAAITGGRPGFNDTISVKEEHADESPSEAGNRCSRAKCAAEHDSAREEQAAQAKKADDDAYGAAVSALRVARFPSDVRLARKKYGGSSRAAELDRACAERLAALDAISFLKALDALRLAWTASDARAARAVYVGSEHASELDQALEERLAFVVFMSLRVSGGDDEPGFEGLPHPDWYAAGERWRANDFPVRARSLGGLHGGRAGRTVTLRRERSRDSRVLAALDWLRDHQNFDGSWRGASFHEDSTRKSARKTFNLEFIFPGMREGDKGWEECVDIGLTGMALLAFVGAGFDHKEGDYKETCRRAIMYLRKAQANDGCFGPKYDDSFIYCHALCAMALAEAYGLSGDHSFRSTVERAVEFMIRAQNPGSGWRYGVKYGESDSSVTGCMVLALKSSQMVGIDFDSHEAYGGAAEWLEYMTIPVRGYPKTGYNEPGSDNARLRSSHDYLTNPSMDAINVMTRLFMGADGWDLNNSTLKAQANNMVDPAFLPTWDHQKIDYYYWYYASLALYQVGGDNWKKWEEAISKVLLNNQRGFRPEDKGTTKDTLDEHGSWDSVDAWHTAGGRVYSTAINCLTLVAASRFPRQRE